MFTDHLTPIIPMIKNMELEIIGEVVELQQEKPQIGW